MGLLDPIPTPYDPLEWEKLPLIERGRLVCREWALTGYGAPLGIYLVYALKVALYVGAWACFCALSPSLGPLSEIGEWALRPLAFQKAILFSMLFEGLGLGCGSGPLTGRYLPPIGGLLYWLRPGTTKSPLFEGAPLIGEHQRGWVEVLLYLALLLSLLRALIAAEITPSLLWPIAILLPLLGILDRTLFLAFRAEHFLTTLLCFLFAQSEGEWIAGAMAVQLALWIWAGVSKLNRHFPAVVCVMTSNSPFARSAWLRKKMYRSFPEDLRPSRLATSMAHLGAALELGVPAAYLFASLLAPSLGIGPEALWVATALTLTLHGYITSNVPMGVPIEWNVVVIYGAFALFWAHPEVSLAQLGASPAGQGLAAFLALALVALPLFGNLLPERLSFLLSMRYYAGNWAYSVWLFKGESYRKLDRLTKSSPWIYDQLYKLYDRATAAGMVGKVMAFRMMHLHGRALSLLIPKAVAGAGPFEGFVYLDGEIVAGLALGWNFGDGHLHNEGLLRALQAQCGFEEGELRCVFVEPQPLGSDRMRYRIADAAGGELERGELSVRELRARKPWGP